MRRYRGYSPVNEDVEVRPLSLAEIQGMPLPDDEQVFGPAMDLTGRPTDTMQRQHSAQLADQEAMMLGDMGEYGQGMAQGEQDMRMSQDRQEQLLEQLQQLMAWNKMDQQQMLAKEQMPLNQVYRGVPIKSQPMPSYDSMSFGDAFKTARSYGAKVFTWRGKRYNTKLKK